MSVTKSVVRGVFYVLYNVRGVSGFAFRDYLTLGVCRGSNGALGKRVIRKDRWVFAGGKECGPLVGGTRSNGNMFSDLRSFQLAPFGGSARLTRKGLKEYLKREESVGAKRMTRFYIIGIHGGSGSPWLTPQHCLIHDLSCLLEAANLLVSIQACWTRCLFRSELYYECHMKAGVHRGPPGSAWPSCRSFRAPKRSLQHIGGG